MKAESYFLTDQKGKPMCERCNANPIVAENGDHQWLCYRCHKEDYEVADELVESDDDLICCDTELEKQSSEYND